MCNMGIVVYLQFVPQDNEKDAPCSKLFVMEKVGVGHMIQLECEKRPLQCSNIIFY